MVTSGGDTVFYDGAVVGNGSGKIAMAGNCEGGSANLGADFVGVNDAVAGAGDKGGAPIDSAGESGHTDKGGGAHLAAPSDASGGARGDAANTPSGGASSQIKACGGATSGNTGNSAVFEGVVGVLIGDRESPASQSISSYRKGGSGGRRVRSRGPSVVRAETDGDL